MRTRGTLALTAILLISAAIVAGYFRRAPSPVASHDQIPPTTRNDTRSVTALQGTPAGDVAKSPEPAAADKPPTVPVSLPRGSGGGSGGGRKSVETEPFFEKKLDRSFAVAKGEVNVRFKQGLTDEEINLILVEIGATVLEKKEQLGLYRLKIPANTSVSAFLEANGANENMPHVEPNIISFTNTREPITSDAPN